MRAIAASIVIAVVIRFVHCAVTRSVAQASRRVFAARKRHAIPRVANACGRAGRFGAFRFRPDECELQGARTYSVLGVSRPVMLQALAPKGESNHHRR
jgi:hypothetical protein